LSTSKKRERDKRERERGTEPSKAKKRRHAKVNSGYFVVCLGRVILSSIVKKSLRGGALIKHILFDERVITAEVSVLARNNMAAVFARKNIVRTDYK
jgi:hypothetical protein